MSSKNQFINGSMRFLLTIGFITSSLGLFAQSEIPIYSWKSYLPYLNGEAVTQNDSKIIYGTEWSLLTLDKEDGSVDFISKVEGLSDIGINIVSYDNQNDQLIVVYDNSNIDLIKDDEVFNVNNIKNNINIVGDRRINALEIADNNCYLATAFGIVEYNLERREFGFTSFTDLNILDITSSETDLFIATEDGIYKGNYSSGLNLGDFGNWDLIEDTVNLPMIYSSSKVHFFDDQLYSIVGDDLVKQQADGTFSTIYTESRQGWRYTFLTSGTRLMVGLWDENIDSEVLFFEEDGSYTQIEDGCVIRVQDAIEDEDGGIWFADLWGSIRRTSGFDQPCKFPKSFNSPNAETASDMAFKNGKVLVASGGVTDAFGSQGFNRGIYKYEEGEWRNYTKFSLDAIGDNELRNIWQIESHPTLPLVYAGSYYNGLLEIDVETDSTRVFNKDMGDSSLQGTQGDEQRTRVSGLAFDRDNNLWMTNFGAPKPLSVFTSEGTWHSFDSAGNDQLAHLTIDNLGYKWAIAVGNNGGVMVFDDGGTPNNPTDDQGPKFFNVGNSEISTNLINYIKADLNGDVWVGTAEGPVVFECGSGVFDAQANCEGSRRKVLQDSIAAFLLQTEDIRVIEIDGANRKWFGTRNGIFVQSSDGETQILHLTAENSLLFDNTITALSFNGETGEMWIGTNKGMQSFRTDATDPSNLHKEDTVLAFPNPVRPNYTGPIAIKGLVEDADVKITDMNGQLIFETRSIGGQAIWDGNDYNGNRASSGVYLVFSSSTDNFGEPNAYVTKIMVMN